jgi:hypothetical protein
MLVDHVLDLNILLDHVLDINILLDHVLDINILLDPAASISDINILLLVSKETLNVKVVQ